jgi:hypothetical protein
MKVFLPHLAGPIYQLHLSDRPRPSYLVGVVVRSEEGGVAEHDRPYLIVFRLEGQWRDGSRTGGIMAASQAKGIRESLFVRRLTDDAPPATRARDLDAPAVGQSFRSNDNIRARSHDNIWNGEDLGDRGSRVRSRRGVTADRRVPRKCRRQEP